MPSEFRWNRLIIHAQSEGEFCAAFEESVESLVNLEYDEIECDLTDCVGLSSRAADLVHWAMVLFGECGKAVELRLPATLQGQMQTTPVPSNVRIDWVMRVQGDAEVVAEIISDTPAPKQRDSSERRTSSRPFKGLEPTDPAETLRTGGREAAVQTDTGTPFRADTAALLDLSRGIREETDAKAKEASDEIRSELTSTPIPQFAGDSTTTDRRKPVEHDDTMTTNEVKKERGWVSSKWVDLGGAKAYLRLDANGERRELGEDLIVGRDGACDWPINEVTVSKRHFRLFISKNRWHLHDMDSTNGTFLNFLELKGPPVPITDGDVIAIAVNDDAPEGTVRFTFLLDETEKRG